MPPKYYDKKQIADLLGITIGEFHHEVKKLIKKDFKEELAQFGVDNPDILLDEQNLMYLADSEDHNSYIETNVSIFDYIEKE